MMSLTIETRHQDCFHWLREGRCPLIVNNRHETLPTRCNIHQTLKPYWACIKMCGESEYFFISRWKRWCHNIYSPEKQLCSKKLPRLVVEVSIVDEPLDFRFWPLPMMCVSVSPTSFPTLNIWVFSLLSSISSRTVLVTSWIPLCSFPFFWQI